MRFHHPTHPLHPACATLARLALTAMLLLGCAAATASPGAHGPNGEHLDAPGTPALAGAAPPRLEATSAQFELVAQLWPQQELSMLIDRFDTNAPVLDATVEIESGDLKAAARFHADHGDYAVDDPAMLRRLATPGQHPLVITVLADGAADLLHGTLTVAAPDAAHEAAHTHAHTGERLLWGAAAVVVLTLVSGIAWWRQRQGQCQPSGPLAPSPRPSPSPSLREGS